MQLSKSSASSEALLHSDWAPRLLRFFQLFLGEQAAAEQHTIETLVEGAALGGVRLSIGMPAALVRSAGEKAGVAPEPGATPQDDLVRAVRSLPLSQKTVVLLFRGLGLSLEEVAAISSISVRQARRLCADGLLAIHRSLASVDAKRDSTAGKHIGEF